MTTRLFAAVMAIAMCGLANAATINVPADYTTIQAAIDAASNGDEILVAPGTYTGTSDQVVDMLGKAITLRASGLVEETIIDGENIRRGIACFSGETAATEITGFTIANGLATLQDYNANGNLDWWEDGGAGIFCYSSSPTLTQCVVLHSDANNYGEGGGVGCYYNSNPTLSHCTIASNSAGSGGGIGCYYNSSPTLTACSIYDNVAGTTSPGGGGGGIHCGYNSSVTLNGCTISGNLSLTTGGGINCLSGNLTLSTCTITNNVCEAIGGGGIYCGNSGGMLIDCTISNNTANGAGGGAYFHGQTVSLSDCTILDNSASTDGGGVSITSSSNTIIANTIVCGNAPNQIDGSWTDNGGNLVTDECPECAGDNDDNGEVNIDDLLTVIGNFTCTGVCDGDVDGNGIVDIDDLLIVIGSFGPCP